MSSCSDRDGAVTFSISRGNCMPLGFAVDFYSYVPKARFGFCEDGSAPASGWRMKAGTLFR
jgi:hypothetical protein